MDKIKVGYLYDNISRNIGDLAIGLSVKKMLLDIGLEESHIKEMIPGISDINRYENIIIGGGLLIRKRGDFFYDKFRIKGNSILNCVGILKDPNDLQYLTEYKYITVRSESDKNKLKYLNKKIFVVPDTTLLLDDIPLNIKINKPSIGIHCFSSNNFNEINLFIKKYSEYFYIYLLPITHYNYDFEFQNEIFSSNQGNKKLIQLPVLSPLETFSTIGKFSYFISYSLHGAYFAYKHNVPFILINDLYTGKMNDFMNDRNLSKFLFNNAHEIDEKFSLLLNSKLDYTKMLNRDYKLLENHKNTLSNIILPNVFYSNNTKKIIKQKNTTNSFYSNESKYYYTNKFNQLTNQINSLSKQIKEVNKVVSNYQSENQNLTKQIEEVKQKISIHQNNLNVLTSSKYYKIWRLYCKLKDHLKI